MMIAYAILGSVVSIVLLALQFRLLLRIWSRMRWIHPSVHEMGMLFAPTRGSTVPTSTEIEDGLDKGEGGSAKQGSHHRGETQ